MQARRSFIEARYNKALLEAEVASWQGLNMPVDKQCSPSVPYNLPDQ